RVELDLDDLLAADRERRETIAKIEQKRARKNEIAQAIPKAAKEERPTLIEEGKSVKAELEQLEPALTQAQKRFDDLRLRVPSVPRPEVPIGVGEADNVEIRRVGTVPKFDFPARDHVQLMTLHRMVEWDGPRRFTGGRSYALRGAGALLELAVTRLAMDVLV